MISYLPGVRFPTWNAGINFVSASIATKTHWCSLVVLYSSCSWYFDEMPKDMPVIMATIIRTIDSSINKGKTLMPGGHL
jgi:hypothetical protein